MIELKTSSLTDDIITGSHAFARDSIFFKNIQVGLAQLADAKMRAYQYNKRLLVFQYNKLKVFHYQPKATKILTPPLLVVFATVNRPEILDLFPQHSFIGALLDAGIDVYLLDWGYPDKHDQGISFSDYVIDYLDRAVKCVMKTSQQKQINVLGICQGGLITLCYATLFKNIHKLVLISTPVDFHTEDNMISHCIQQIEFDHVLKIMGGNVPGDWLTQFFIYMRPFELIGKKYLRFMDNLSDERLTDRFLQVEKWLHDAPDQAGLAFKEFVENFYQKNNLIKNKIVIGNQIIDLQKLTLPVLNVMANEDEIIPISASRALQRFIDNKYYSEALFPSGHIGIYVSNKVGKNMSNTISQWLYPYPPDLDVASLHQGYGKANETSEQHQGRVRDNLS